MRCDAFLCWQKIIARMPDECESIIEVQRINKEMNPLTVAQSLRFMKSSGLVMIHERKDYKRKIVLTELGKTFRTCFESMIDSIK